MIHADVQHTVLFNLLKYIMEIQDLNFYQMLLKHPSLLPSFSIFFPFHTFLVFV